MREFISLKKYTGSLGKKYTFIYKEDNKKRTIHFGSGVSQTYVEGGSDDDDDDGGVC